MNVNDFLKHYFFNLFLLSGLFFSSCHVYWKDNPNNYLLTQIKVKTDQPELKKHDFDKALYPTLNKKIFGARFYLALYEWGDQPNLQEGIEKKKAKLAIKEEKHQQKYEVKKEKWLAKKHKKNQRLDRRGYDTVAYTYKLYTPKKYNPTFNEWLVNVAGEAPVLVDTSAIETGVKRLSNYLFMSGFLENEVSYQIEYHKKKQKAKAYYFVKAEPSYKFKNLEYDIKDSAILELVLKNKKKSLIIPNKRFDFSVLEAERKRLFQVLYGKGYYEMSPEHVIYEADTNQLEKTVNLVLHIDRNYQLYHFNKVNFFLDVKPVDKNDPDLIHQHYKGYDFYYFSESKKQKMPYRSAYLIRNLQIQPQKDIFDYRKISEAQDRFVGGEDIGVFQYTDFNIEANPEEANLDLDFFLNSAKRKSFMTEVSGTIRGQNLGFTATVGFTYKNIFRGAEKLNFVFSGGVEAQPLVTESGASENWKNYVPNTFQLNPQITLQLPQILFPFSAYLFPNTIFTQTTILLSYDFQKRPDYQRTNQKIAFFYQWKTINQPYLSHFLTPFEITYSYFGAKSAAFLDRLESLQDQYLKALFEDYFVPATSYTLNIHKGDLLEPQTSVFHNYSTLELSGNLLRWIARSSGFPQNSEGAYRIAGVPFTQYVKIFNDFRYFYNINQKSTVALRSFIGVIQPLKNSKIIPFERRFFVGGTNDLRGWQNYAVGPGSSFDTIQNFDKVGDIKLLFSAEYRFNVFSYLDMAFFADAGNIWLMYKNENYPNGEFDWTRFYKEIALSVGIGLRLNFNNYLIFRVDTAFPFYDPSFTPKEKWIWDSKALYNQAIRQYNAEHGTKLNPYSYVPVFNIGIGFPF